MNSSYVLMVGPSVNVKSSRMDEYFQNGGPSGV